MLTSSHNVIVCPCADLNLWTVLLENDVSHKALVALLAHLIPIEVVEWMLGRKLIMQDVMNVEILVRDVIAIYAAWTR